MDKMSKKVFELRGLIYSRYENEAQCAREMGWPRQKLSKITNGTKEPDIKELAALAVALDVSMEKVAQIFLSRRSPTGQQSA